MIVIGTSVLVTALVDDGPDGHSVRGRLQGVELSAPAHLDVEWSHHAPGSYGQPHALRRRYVALAELLSAPLVTSDARLARATGPRCVIELIRGTPAG